MKSNSEQLEDVQRQIEYWDNHFRKNYNLGRCSLIAHSVTSKRVVMEYKDLDAVIKLTVKL